MTEAGILVEREFARELARALTASLPASIVTVTGDLELAIRDASGFEQTAFLANAYKDYSLNPASFDRIVRDHVATVSRQRAGGTALDRARIVPIIKDRQWLADLQDWLRSQSPAQEQLFDTFNDELVVVYAIDHPNSVEFLAARNDLAMSRDELRALAVANLRRILPDIEMRGDSDVLMVTAGGNYEASLLLIDEIWSGGQIKVDGDIVVAVPTRDVLLVTGSRNHAGVMQLRERAAALVEQGARGLIDTLFVYRNRQFAKFDR